MRAARRLWRRLTSRARTSRDEERLQAEIEEHISLQTADNLRAGMPLAEARRQAMLKFGGVEPMKEEYRDQKGLPFLETLLQDTRYATRSLRKVPTFTAAIVLTLALGIGATTSIFTLAHAVLMKSLAVANPAELYRLGRETHCCVWGGYSQDKEFSIVSDELYLYLRDHTQGFAELAAFNAGGGNLFGVRRVRGGEPAQSYPGKFVSGNYFTMFGLRPFAGRLLSKGDDAVGAPPVAVMSYRLWQQKYGSDPSIIGSVFTFNNQPLTVVGIIPPSFYGDTLTDSPPDFYLPLATEPQVMAENSLLRTPNSHWLDLIGRIRPGTSAAAIEAQMRVELKQWLQSHWSDMNAIARAEFPHQTLYLSPGGAGITSMREQYEHWLDILMIVAGFVLAIVCANVANLMLVRGMERRQQTSLSIALGARVSRMVRQALTECVLLSLLGGVAGLGVAYAGTQLILHFAFNTLEGFATVPISAAPSMPVMFFAFGISLITGVVFGIAPAWMTARVDPIEALRGVNRTTKRTASLPRKILVVLQAALSLTLLSASGLLTAALRNLENQDFGFDQNRRTVASIDPSLAGYRADQLSLLFHHLHDSVAAIPGVDSVSAALYAPMSGDSWNDEIYVDGRPAPGPKDDAASGWTRVTPGFFTAIGNPILRGRAIDERDIESAPHVAVINEAFARKFFKNEDPIGKHFGRTAAYASRIYEVVGIAKNARYLTYNYEKPIGAFFFAPADQFDAYRQAEFTEGDLRSHFLHDIVIVAKPGVTLSDGALRKAVASVDPNMPIVFIRSMRQQVADHFSQQRLIARLTSFFGILSLILASIGLYGVTAHNVGRRVGEIGLRMALGADRGQVVTLVLRGAFGLIGVGLLVGLPLTMFGGQVLGAELYGMSPYNIAVTVISLLALALSAFLAALIPALRASRISPLDALRAE